MDIFKEGLEPVKEPTQEDVVDAINMILDKAPKWAIVEELEEIAEYILILEKALEKNGIALDKNDMNEIKFEDEEEFKKEKKWLLLHFVGKIIKKEGP
ncbi:MAG: hypothetical protein ACP5PO_05645 [Desulfurella sp.]|uniref:hypothetical protein n=1 Tax=Desulfurella sp. TaxID=1962857 RepID=UPI0003E08791|nr:hypothetical protein [Desulfurella sp.]AHF98015.1 hypothetical protein DESACE_06030 [Desulfurella acetivorans A63]PMP92297.1 MAG: hypothetical protein C0173_02420 [Desulfurella sp.]HEX13923.1 hypothetical protein [Desulfurella acetivorans]